MARNGLRSETYLARTFERHRHGLTQIVYCSSSDTGTTSNAATEAPTEQAAFTYTGFATPESVLFVQGRGRAEDRYLVSNINGDPFAKDNGFISQLKVTAGGPVTGPELKWIQGTKERPLACRASSGRARSLVS